jgi:hypothetical protein
MNHESALIRQRMRTPRAAGIAFLWFIAVVHDRLGEREDRFFATCAAQKLHKQEITHLSAPLS